MQTATRHGDGAHYVRPDRVYRTGVLASVMGYQPDQDVQDVAASFTAYPMDLRLGLSGLGAGQGFLQSLGARIKAFFQGAPRALPVMALPPAPAQQTMASVATGLFTPDPTAAAGGMAYAQIGEQVVPFAFGQNALVANLVSGGLPERLAASQGAVSWHRWNSLRWND